jgi:hypothetical protein
MSVVLHRKPVDLTAWQLTDQTEMVAALTALQELGWRGGINYSQGAWILELNADNPQRGITATIGDWLILDLGLRKVSESDCAAAYEAQ